MKRTPSPMPEATSSEEELNQFIIGQLSAGREPSQEQLRAISNFRELQALPAFRTNKQLDAYLSAAVPGVKVVSQPMGIGEFGYVQESVPDVMNINQGLQGRKKEVVKLHEQEHLLKNRAVQALPERERIDNDIRFDQLYGDESGRTRRDIVSRMVNNRDKIEKFFGMPLGDAYFSKNEIKRQGRNMGAMFEEQIATLSALEQVTGKSLTKGLPELFPDDKAAAIYDSITGLRQTRLDAKDLPPYTPQYESTMDWLKKKLPRFRAQGSPEEGEMPDEESRASLALKALVDAGRGFLGLEAARPGSEAYRTGQALSNMPAIGLPAAAIRGVGSAKKALDLVDAPSVMKRGKLAEVEKKILESQGELQAKRLQRAADEVPGLEDQYSAEALLRALAGTKGAPFRGVVTLDPKKFESFAAKLNDPLSKDSVENIEMLQWVLRDKKGFDEVPMLMLDKKTGRLVEVYGHEGRHRNRAMAAEGMPKTLVEVKPSRSLEFGGVYPEGMTSQQWRDLLNKTLDEDSRLVVGEKSRVLNPEVERIMQQIRRLEASDSPDWEKLTKLSEELEEWKKSSDYVLIRPRTYEKLPEVYKKGGEVKKKDTLQFIKKSSKRR